MGIGPTTNVLHSHCRRHADRPSVERLMSDPTHGCERPDTWVILVARQEGFEPPTLSSGG